MSEGIPAIINMRSGRAAEAVRTLAEVGGFDISEVEPGEIVGVIRRVIAVDPKRILVVGGDGSLCAAANLMAGRRTELAVLPAGTLNHFAKHLGMPLGLRDAAILARQGITRPIDAGRVNGRIFLNTSSVGAYESFVRRRRRLERRWGYRTASLLAGWQVLVSTSIHRVTVEIGGVAKTYRTPLVFVGVGERELRIPALGGRMEHGKRGLHLMVVRDRAGARLAALALAAAARGIEAMSRTPALESLIVERFTIEGPHRVASVDGELMSVETPLDYTFLPGALSVVVPERRDSIHRSTNPMTR
jgi:diacylglycerol kinase family enzyme